MSGLRTAGLGVTESCFELLFSSEGFGKSRYGGKLDVSRELVIPRAYKPHTGAIRHMRGKSVKPPSPDIAIKKRHSHAIEPTVLTSRVLPYISYHL